MNGLDKFFSSDAEENERRLINGISDVYANIVNECGSGHYAIDYDLDCEVVILKVRTWEQLSELSLERIHKRGYELMGKLRHGEYTYYLFYPNEEVFKKRVRDLGLTKKTNS